MQTQKSLRTILGLLQLLIALGAVAGGINLLVDLSGKGFGFTLDMLTGTPFRDYLIPGLYLLIINGSGSLLAAVLTFRGNIWSAEIAVAFGLFLMGWIAVQMIWLGYLSWMQPFYFILGFLEAALGVWLWLAMRALKPAH